MCIHYRSLSRRWCGGPRCLASGPSLSAAPAGQRPTPGSTDAFPATWCSSARLWSAPTWHTTPPAWPSRSCTYASHNIMWYFLWEILYFCLKIILVSFCFSASQFLVNTTSPPQTSRGKTFSTPSGRTSPQVSPQTNTHLQSSLQFSDFLAKFVDFRWQYFSVNVL